MKNETSAGRGRVSRIHQNKVLAVYDRVEQKGSRGETSESVFSRLRVEMKTYANEQGK